MDPFCQKDIISSDTLLFLLKNYLGEQNYLHEYVNNVALKNTSTSQTPHPDQEYNPNYRVGVVCNFSFSFIDDKNGMTNIWPKTHNSTVQVHRDILTEYGSIQPSLEAGDMLVRDISLVHQGMPNKSDLDRYLLALVFKSNNEKIMPYAISDIPQNFWDTCTNQQKSLLRYHHLVDTQKVFARCYPAPKETFEGYEKISS